MCAQMGWELKQIRFYTGIPNASTDPNWHVFWASKFLTMSRQGIRTIPLPIETKNQWMETSDGKRRKGPVSREEGVGTKIVLDVVRLALKRRYDIALIFSQAQAFSEVVNAINLISEIQDRWIKVASAFPEQPPNPGWSPHGIDGTDWVPISQDLYNKCLDPVEYSPAIFDARTQRVEVLDAFSEIEILVSNIIYNLKRTKGVSNSKLKAFKNMSIDYKINVDLVFMLSPLSKEEERTLEQVNMLRQLRNNIAHRSSTASKEDARRANETKRKFFEMITRRGISVQ